MAGPKTGKRGFGTGKGKPKGSKNRHNTEVRETLAKIGSGAMDEPALKLLQITHPKVHAGVMNSLDMKRALKADGVKVKPAVERRRLKVKERIEAKSPLDHLTDAEVVRDAMMKNGTDRETAMKIVATMAKCTGLISLEREAAKLRDIARIASLSDRTKLEMAVNNYREYYGREPEPRKKPH